MAQYGARSVSTRTRRAYGLKTLAVLGGLGAVVAASPVFAAPKGDHISGSDLQCLALNVYREARNQPPEGQLAVAHVTLNRFESSDLPTICDVVFQPGIFAWTKDPKVVKAWPRDGAAWDRAQRIAIKALADPMADPVQGSTYFHTADIDPNWGPGLVRVGRIGDHVFYKPRALTTAPTGRHLIAVPARRNPAVAPAPRNLAAATPPN